MDPGDELCFKAALRGGASSSSTGNWYEDRSRSSGLGSSLSFAPSTVALPICGISFMGVVSGEKGGIVEEVRSGEEGGLFMELPSTDAKEESRFPNWDPFSPMPWREGIARDGPYPKAAGGAIVGGRRDWSTSVSVTEILPMDIALGMGCRRWAWLSVSRGRRVKVSLSPDTDIISASMSKSPGLNSNSLVKCMSNSAFLRFLATYS